MQLDPAFDSLPDCARQATHFDPAALHRDMFNSTPAVFSVLRTFQPWLADMRAQLRTAANTNNKQQLASTAHTLRGGLTQLRAETAVESVRQLEILCKADPDTTVPSDHPSLRTLEAELNALGAEIEQLLASAQRIAPRQ